MKRQTCATVYGSGTIVFLLAFGETDSIRFTVHPDRSVEVLAPAGQSIEAIKERVRRRGAWIRRQQSRFERPLRGASEKRYISGESFRYLGRQYRLRVVETKPAGVAMSRGQLEARVVDRSDRAEVKRRLDQWYRDRAMSRFSQRFEICLEKVRRYGISCSGFRLLRMEKRWGSCTRAGTIMLNPDLVKTPVDCIDYVILHELCHLKEFEHGAGFYRLLGKVCPEWDSKKRRLEATEA